MSFSRFEYILLTKPAKLFWHEVRKIGGSPECAARGLEPKFCEQSVKIILPGEVSNIFPICRFGMLRDVSQGFWRRNEVFEGVWRRKRITLWERLERRELSTLDFYVIRIAQPGQETRSGNFCFLTGQSTDKRVNQITWQFCFNVSTSFY